MSIQDLVIGYFSKSPEKRMKMKFQLRLFEKNNLDRFENRVSLEMDYLANTRRKFYNDVLIPKFPIEINDPLFIKSFEYRMKAFKADLSRKIIKLRAVHP